jgi:hypothetical protein
MKQLPKIDAFEALLFQIVGQQLSMRSRRAFNARLEALFALGETGAALVQLPASPVLAVDGPLSRLKSRARDRVQRIVGATVRDSERPEHRLTHAQLEGSRLRDGGRRSGLG